MTATHALGWALVHSLWQCALAAVALALLLAIVPARSARIRYALATATLVLTLALPLTTAVRVGEASPATPGNGLATSAVASRPASDAAPAACVEALERLAARLRVSRPVRVLESAVLQVPAVLGWVRPVILVPASALTGLTPLQLDALLAHELAHVRRYDYLVNLIQSV